MREPTRRGYKMQAAIYARFSTELQNERSIDDQVALCRRYAERNDLKITAVYEDRPALAPRLLAETASSG